MQKKKKDKHFIKKPYYEGGNTAFRKFVHDKMKYPKEALEAKVEGVVHLKAEIDISGKVSSSKIISGIGFGCDEEAQRILSLVKYEMPKLPRRSRVKFQKNIRIQFTMPKIKSKPKAKAKPKDKVQGKVNISYEIKKKKVEATDGKKKASYSYTIEVNKKG